MSDEFQKIKGLLERGEVFAYPTETVYGLGADPLQRISVERIMQLKGRPLHQTPLILIPNREWITRLTKDVSPAAVRLMDAFWPGPLTIVFEASREVPSWLLRDDETIALRISSHPWVTSFLKAYDKPLISTSANASGQPSATDIVTVKRYFPEGVSHFVDAGTLKSSQSSTIVSLQDSHIQLLRQGDITLDQLKKFTDG